MTAQRSYIPNFSPCSLAVYKMRKFQESEHYLFYFPKLKEQQKIIRHNGL